MNLNTHPLARVGAVYTFEVVDKNTGIVLDREVVKNLVPDQGLDLIASALFAGGAIPADWYIGLYGGDYTPTSGVTAATLPALAGELSSYMKPTRVLFQPDAIVAGSAMNTTNKAEFSFAAATSVYGCFIASAASKGATTGYLLSVVRSPSLKQVDASTVLRVHAGFQFLSL